MEEQQQKEFRALRDGAFEILRDGYQDMRAGRRIFQLLVIPSFSAAFSIEGWYKGRRASDNLFTLLLWDFDEDVKKFRTPVERLKYCDHLFPTIRVQTAILKDETLREITERLEVIKVPAWIEHSPGGIDGTSYELSLGDSTTYAKFSWWPYPPSQWESLAEIASVIKGYARNIFDGYDLEDDN